MVCVSYKGHNSLFSHLVLLNINSLRSLCFLRKEQLSFWSSCTAQHQFTSFFVFPTKDTTLPSVVLYCSTSIHSVLCVSYEGNNSPFGRLVLLNINSLRSLCFLRRTQLSLRSSCTAQHQFTPFFVFPTKGTTLPSVVLYCSTSIHSVLCVSYEGHNSPFGRLVLLNINSLRSLCFLRRAQLSLRSSCTAQHQFTPFFVFPTKGTTLPSVVLYCSTSIHSVLCVSQ
ncbi:hypothetical protein RV18_GL003433 [Enterococcus termitis]|nr:hypothetical protein RV18_GL003433 [Enterococcus termitis]